MANQSMTNIKGLMHNKTTRIGVVLTFGVIVAALVYANMTASNQQARPKELQATVATPGAPGMTVSPGTSDSPLHNEKIREMNRQKALEAERSGESVVPRLTSPTGDREKDPFDLLKRKGENEVRATEPQVPVPVAPAAPRPPAPAPAPAPVQVAQIPVAKAQAQVQGEKEMSAAMAGLLNSWNAAPQRVETDYAPTKGAPSAPSPAQASAPAGGSVEGFQAAAPAASPKKVALKAGSILHAVMITSVNSDEPGPILAQITTGPYAGGRVIGRFELGKDAQKMTLNFSTLTMQNAEKSYQISGYAVDPETARTALASDVDNHYLARYGAFAGATFLKGYATALGQSGSTQTVTAGAAGVSATTTYPTLNNKQIALSALGEVGGEVAGTLKEGIKRPPTVTLNSGTEIGILVMQDASF